MKETVRVAVISHSHLAPLQKTASGTTTATITARVLFVVATVSNKTSFRTPVIESRAKADVRASMIVNGALAVEIVAAEIEAVGVEAAIAAMMDRLVW